MALDRSAVLSQLAALSGDLTNISGAPTGGKLHQARVTLASALAAAQLSVVHSQPTAAGSRSSPRSLVLLPVGTARVE